MEFETKRILIYISLTVIKLKTYTLLTMVNLELNKNQLQKVQF